FCFSIIVASCSFKEQINTVNKNTNSDIECKSLLELSEETLLLKNTNDNKKRKQVELEFQNIRKKVETDKLVGLGSYCATILGKVNYFSMMKEDLKEFAKHQQIQTQEIKNQNKTERLILSQKIPFPQDRFNLSTESEELLKPILTILSKYPEIHIKIIAHSSERRISQFDIWLTDKRANSIKKSLLKQENIQDRIQMVSGFSCFQPLPGLKKGDPENERIEFILFLP
ncbi:MAG: OmpA family protein, partial [Leptospiraceae bacterium]|nr:OmpA family protein [Leptospiraceae bacterium]